MEDSFETGMASDQLNPSRSKTSKAEKRFACPYCDVTCGWKSHLTNHMRTHTKEKPFPCEFCDKSFAMKDTLVKHVRIHTGEKPHPCHICNRSFSRKAEMQLHLRTHTGEKPYSCHVCSQRFAWKGALRSHIQNIHEGSKPFCCPICEKTFGRKFQLERHQRTHRKDKPFSCTQCEQTSAWEGSIARHYMKCHMHETSDKAVLDLSNDNSVESKPDPTGNSTKRKTSKKKNANPKKKIKDVNEDIKCSTSLSTGPPTDDVVPGSSKEVKTDSLNPMNVPVYMTGEQMAVAFVNYDIPVDGSCLVVTRDDSNITNSRTGYIESDTAIDLNIKVEKPSPNDASVVESSACSENENPQQPVEQISTSNHGNSEVSGTSSSEQHGSRVFCSICAKECSREGKQADDCDVLVLICAQCQETTVECSFCGVSAPLSKLKEHLGEHDC